MVVVVLLVYVGRMLVGPCIKDCLMRSLQVLWRSDSWLPYGRGEGYPSFWLLLSSARLLGSASLSKHASYDQLSFRVRRKCWLLFSFPLCLSRISGLQAREKSKAHTRHQIMPRLKYLLTQHPLCSSRVQEIDGVIFSTFLQPGTSILLSLSDLSLPLWQKLFHNRKMTAGCADHYYSTIKTDKLWLFFVHRLLLVLCFH